MLVTGGASQAIAAWEGQIREGLAVVTNRRPPSENAMRPFTIY